MYQIMGFFVIFCGVIRIKKLMDGVRIREELAIRLEPIMLSYFVKSRIWILSVELIRLLRMVSNSLLIDNLLPYSQPPITVASSTIRQH